MAATAARLGRALLARLEGRMWILGAAGCALLMWTQVEFSPPEKVRIDDAAAPALVGEAPNQSFREDLADPQSVQIRASLRQFPDANRGVLDAGEETTEPGQEGRLLSQPVVTTILGMSANIDQRVSLEGGELEVQLHVEATPRILVEAKTGKNARVAMLSLEHRVEVQSTRHRSFGRSDVQTVHLESRGNLVGVESSPHRIVFEVEGQLFALDLELHHAV